MTKRPRGEAKIAVQLRCSGVVTRDAHVLLGRHRRGDRSYWVLPGGSPLPGEVASAAVEREIREESGLSVQARGVLFVWEGLSPRRERRIVELAFRADLVGERAEPVSGDPSEEPRWVHLDDLGTLSIYPPVAGYLRGAWRRGLTDAAPYLGNMWRSMPRDLRPS
jgi:8-oxo-dGTP diphosphatase